MKKLIKIVPFFLILVFTACSQKEVVEIKTMPTIVEKSSSHSKVIAVYGE